MKVLNLYSGLGGNRKKWDNVEVTAVDNNKEIAAVYKRLYPNDAVIVGDAHQYLLDHYEEFDFIWSSPPCQTHSRMNKTDKKRYDLLSQLGCICCLMEKGVISPPEIHHINGRTGNGNQETIGLCYYHHREGSDCDEYTSRHPFKARFIERYGSEEYLLEETNKRLTEV